MQTRRSVFPLALTLLAAAGCTGLPGDGSGGSGGAGAGAGGTPAVGGGVGAGGSPAVGGGVGTGGTPAVGGGVGTGGTPAVGGGVGTGGTTPASGGADTGAGGADVGSGGSSAVAAKPSAGCGNSTTGNGTVTGAIVSFPSSYDGSTPMPMIFGFHGAGRSNEQFRTADARTQGHALESAYIMVYLKSDGNDWLASTNKAKLDAAYSTMLTNNCVDENRTFMIGHSSGAQFITTLLCGGESRFAGVGPVAGGVIGACNAHPAIPALYIHGANDTVRGNNGSQVVDLFVAENSCGASVPYAQASCTSSYDQATVDPGCKEYQDCTDRTIWCSHNDKNYGDGGVGTNHGWPCFANDAIKTFFDAL